ncbi:hypothetical protein NQ318_021269, partial [Aromia moschata]
NNGRPSAKKGNDSHPYPYRTTLQQKRSIIHFDPEAEVRLNISEEDRPEISGGGLIGTYRLDHLHFHWQSEHTMDGYRFPLELHLVHYKSVFGSVAEALQHIHGVAVFAVLFELSPDDDEEFEPLLNIIETLQTRVNTPKPLRQFSVKNFLPRNIAGFYRYEGSLTTPDCNEGILWTVFTNTIPISPEQVRIFEEIRTNHNKALRQNYRSLQPINNRKVYVKISPIRENTMYHFSGSTPMSIPTLHLISIAVLLIYLKKILIQSEI